MVSFASMSGGAWIFDSCIHNLAAFKQMGFLHVSISGFGKFKNLPRINGFKDFFRYTFPYYALYYTKAFPYCQLFNHFDSFNQVQSLFFDDVLHSDKSVVLNTPTGSGKTVAYELAIVRLALQQPGTDATDSHKAVYVAPIKTLCFEKYQEWTERFQPLGINSVQLTGDSDILDLRKIRSAQLIITTPEKWEALTRNSWESDLLKDVRLFMIDEVHLLNDKERGPILEVIVARMKLLRITQKGTQVKLRFIVASATIPNIEDLASWIGGDSGDIAQFKYNELQRPVPLHTHVIGFNSKVNGFKFDMSLNYKIPGIIRRYSDRKATLVFDFF